ncbi:TerB family tellurite resistance protein [Magnetospirillum sp. UT-4]|uniref:tellurite resistance TerB family protein n=1 Tax=Magnetospirillum sp. UT-4 TaxID=2681467 RepID=UPI0013863152|nr:TerB family tellurite resistance protein [Magnetospirillum sp. UT-4]CAA7616429.1 conserved hypothetical protein [Magnetospirillum sp. UT-4]
MFARLKEMLAGGSAEDPEMRLRRAASALLVEAATLDGRLEEGERARVEMLLAERFAIPPAQAAELFAEGCQMVADSVELYENTRIIKDSFDQAERARMMEMLWEVVYADGFLHDYEANLMRRIAGLLYVPDRESGEARKRALARLGLDKGLA